MRFTLKKSGSVTDCREALNAAIAKFQPPETQEQKVIRMAAHYIVADHLDPMHDAWQEEVQAAAASRVPKAQGGMGNDKAKDPPEPKTEFSIDISIDFGAKK